MSDTAGNNFQDIMFEGKTSYFPRGLVGSSYKTQTLNKNSSFECPEIVPVDQHSWILKQGCQTGSGVVEQEKN